MDLIPVGPSTLLGGHRRPELRDRALCPIYRLRNSLVTRDGVLRIEDMCSLHSAVDLAQVGLVLGPGTSNKILPKQGSGLAFTPALRFGASRVTKRVLFLPFSTKFKL